MSTNSSSGDKSVTIDNYSTQPFNSHVKRPNSTLFEEENEGDSGDDEELEPEDPLMEQYENVMINYQRKDSKLSILLIG